LREQRVRRIVAPAAGDAGVLRIEEVATPGLGEGEVLVRLEYAGLNPVDAKQRARSPQGGGFPFVPGCEGSGTIADVHPSVTGLAPGERVAIFAGGLGGSLGCYAEEIAVPSVAVVPLPEEVESAEAAALPLAFLTAWEGLVRLARLEPGSTLLLSGASGGVGHLAAQIAVAAGVRVIALAGADEKRRFVSELGVETVLDYRDERWPRDLEAVAGENGVDCFYDVIGAALINRALPVIRPYGSVVTVRNPVADLDWKTIRGRCVSLHTELVLVPQLLGDQRERERQKSALAHGVELLRDGIVVPHVETIWRASEIVDSHRVLEEEHSRGKMVVDLREEGWK
jgi:NADPH2:quinone reductase